MFESDADRLALIEGLGGLSVTAREKVFTGILDLPHVGVGEVPVDSFAPMLTARTSDLTTAGVMVGTTLVIEGSSYAVRSVQPDGLGMTELVLEAL